MQKPNFPNHVFSVTAQPGNQGEGIKVRVTKIPARFCAKTVSTINNRLIKMEKFGKIDIFAEGPAVLIVTAWVLNQEEVEAMVQKLHQKIQGNLNYRLEKLQKQLLGTVGIPQIMEKDYAD